MKIKHFNQVPATSLVPVIKGIWGHLSSRRKKQFILLIGLMALGSMAEVVSLGAVLPFISVLTDPDRVFEYQIVAHISAFFGITSADQLVLPLTIGFIMAALLAGGVRILQLWANTRLSFAAGHDLSLEIYKRTLYQPYHVHISRNSSDIIGGVNKARFAQATLFQGLTLLTSLLVSLAIISALLVINFLVAFTAAAAFGLIYWLVNWFVRKRLMKNSQTIAKAMNQKQKALQEGLGGIREVLLDGSQPFYVDLFRKTNWPYSHAQGNNQFIAGFPRYAVEGLGLMLIACLAYGLSLQSGGAAAALPLLGALALGAQRLLPAMQQVYNSYSTIKGSYHSLEDVLDLLNQPLPNEALKPVPAPLQYQREIRFEHVRFRYHPESTWMLDDINLNFPKGARIGFVGGTGGGKSTTIDLLMGLLTPTDGMIYVDDLPLQGEHIRAWQASIAHVPQSIYLADTSLAENIALGVPLDRIDMEQVRRAAQQAQIAEFIEGLEAGYHTNVGERGVRLSGGQRQRIGIARALYKKASVLVFDEATSALDNATERAVMEAIEGLGRELTIFMIAHRLTTVQRCDLIIELEEGRVVAQGSYEELLERSPSFGKMAHVAT